MLCRVVGIHSGNGGFGQRVGKLNSKIRISFYKVDTDGFEL